MLFGSTFLLNLLCAIVPCDWGYKPPEVSFRQGKNFAVDDKYPIVETDIGKVKGYQMGTIEGKLIYAFEGIPYAEPPLKNLRFRNPVPKKRWSGVLNGFVPAPFCVQVHPLKAFRVYGVEDCLYLNIYTPIKPSSRNFKKLPVIFYIHGGGYSFGSAREVGPAYLLDHDVVLVAINYRLGVFGFLSTGDMSSPGNYGLKDQALAMKWMSENIGVFGGDKDKVTIMGHSAGAMSVHLHMIANKTRQYFRNAISLSGAAFSYFAIRDPRTSTRAEYNARRLAQNIGCPNRNSKELVDCFKTANAYSLAAGNLQLVDWLPFPVVYFGAVVEPVHPDAFISISPEEAYEQGQVAKYPWMSTLTIKEGLLLVYMIKTGQRMGVFRRHFMDYLPIITDYKRDVPLDKQRIISEKIRDFFLGNESPLTVDQGMFADIISDRLFTYGTEKGIAAHSKIAPTYAYLFKEVSKYNLGGSMGIPKQEWNAIHTEDVFYLFNSTTFSDAIKRTDREYKLSKIMTNLIMNFVNKSVPYYTDPKTKKDLHIWEPVGPEDEIKYLQINSDIKMIPSPFTERIKFWENVGLRDHAKLLYLNKANGHDLNNTI